MSSTQLAYYKGASTTEWRTPQELYERLDAIWHFTLDPAATDDNTLHWCYFTEASDGLIQDWGGHTVFLNPPYSRDVLQRWIRKAADEAKKPGTVVVCLLPAKTGPRYWQEIVIPEAAYIYFIPGRLQFGGARGPAPFDSAIVVFGKLGGQP